MGRRYLRCRPDLHRAIVASRREHEWVGSRIPSDASHVTPQSWRTDVVQVGCGFAVPYVNVPNLQLFSVRQGVNDRPNHGSPFPAQSTSSSSLPPKELVPAKSTTVLGMYV